MQEAVAERIRRAKACIAESVASWRFSDDPATQAFCRSRLEALCHSDGMERQYAHELGGRSWRPPRRLLLVISETDPLGTLEGFLAAYLVGAPMRIKARLTRPWLQALRQTLGLTEEVCEIADWPSGGQDDERLLRDVDVALLAGGEELIRHYRAVAPVSVRLVELGPKTSAMAIFGEDLPPPEAIVRDFALFLQGVCSSPRVVLVERAATARRLFDQLREQLDSMPVLPEEMRLLQMVTASQWEMRATLSSGLNELHYCPDSGWGVTLQDVFAPEQWLPRSIPLVCGDIREMMRQARHRWPGRLQTLGVQGEPQGFRGDDAGFTRLCKIGNMHARSALAPHDGFFVLGALVFFIDDEGLARERA
jgi:hypothetical protein